MSFYQLPHPWDPNYAIPKYVMSEPPERGVFVTAQMPRGTIPALVPDYLAQPDSEVDLGSLGGSSLAGATLKGSSLAGSSLAIDTIGALHRKGPTSQIGSARRASGGSCCDSCTCGGGTTESQCCGNPASGSRSLSGFELGANKGTLLLGAGVAAAAFFLLRKKKRKSRR